MGYLLLVWVRLRRVKASERCLLERPNMDAKEEGSPGVEFGSEFPKEEEEEAVEWRSAQGKSWKGGGCIFQKRGVFAEAAPHRVMWEETAPNFSCLSSLLILGGVSLISAKCPLSVASKRDQRSPNSLQFLLGQLGTWQPAGSEGGQPHGQSHPIPSLREESPFYCHS